MATNIERDGQMFFWRDIPSVAKEKDSISLHNIFPDDNGRFALGIHTNIAAYGDIFITMQAIPGKGFIYLPAIRLRSYGGGGDNPFITEGFGSILSYFSNGMQESFKTEETEPRRGERLISNSEIAVTRNQGESRLSIVGIQDDDRDSSFLDISVLETGDVRLRVRHKESGEKEAMGEMLFKTRKNGGKAPFIAATLTRLAERIAKAKQNQLHF